MKKHGAPLEKCKVVVRKAQDAAESQRDTELTLKDKRVKWPHAEAFRRISDRHDSPH